MTREYLDLLVSPRVKEAKVKGFDSKFRTTVPGLKEN
uniref:Uncharacterized protein n=1 Tax=Anguilla anguilla TaxID=7936 RepID=A0A0E9VFM9_ANGAN